MTWASYWFTQNLKRISMVNCFGETLFSFSGIFPKKQTIYLKIYTQQINNVYKILTLFAY